MHTYMKYSQLLSVIEALALLGANCIESNASPPAGKRRFAKKVSMASSRLSSTIGTDTSWDVLLGPKVRSITLLL